MRFRDIIHSRCDGRRELIGKPWKTTTKVRRTRWTFLESSICINDQVEPSTQLIKRQAPAQLPQLLQQKIWDWQWDVSRLEAGACFPITAQGVTALAEQ